MREGKHILSRHGDCPNTVISHDFIGIGISLLDSELKEEPETILRQAQDKVQVENR